LANGTLLLVGYGHNIFGDEIKQNTFVGLPHHRSKVGQIAGGDRSELDPSKDRKPQLFD